MSEAGVRRRVVLTPSDHIFQGIFTSWNLNAKLSERGECALPKQGPRTVTYAIPFTAF
jgi:hypothetical protein